MRNNEYIVIDTNALLKCPQALDSSISYFNKVYIPKTVIDELNFQKDRGNMFIRKQAGLVLGKLIENKKNYIRIESEYRGRHDDQIFDIANNIARDNSTSTVYILTNDKDYKLKESSLFNLKLINMNELNQMISMKNYDLIRSSYFYNLVADGNMIKISELNFEGIDVNYIDGNSGFTSLINCVRNRNYEMVKFICKLPNIDINSVDNNKFCLPAISHAIQLHDLKMVKTLVECGANVNAPAKNNTNFFNTPLMIASWNGDLEIAEYLIENGACINQQDKKNGFTALIKAVYKNKPKLVKLLIENGADKSISSFECKTAFDYALEKNVNDSYYEILNMLNRK